MGSLCSKPSNHSGGHTVLNSASEGNSPVDVRAAAAAAADKRRAAEQRRGTAASNPNKGQLSSKLEASRTAARLPEPRQEERVVWD